MNHTLWPVYAPAGPGEAHVSLELVRLSLPKVFQDHIEFIRNGFVHSARLEREREKKTPNIYNHDYLDCILLSKQSQGNKGSVFGL